MSKSTNLHRENKDAKMTNKSSKLKWNMAADLLGLAFANYAAYKKLTNEGQTLEAEKLKPQITEKLFAALSAPDAETLMCALDQYNAVAVTPDKVVEMTQDLGVDPEMNEHDVDLKDINIKKPQGAPTSPKKETDDKEEEDGEDDSPTDYKPEDFEEEDSDNYSASESQTEELGDRVLRNQRSL
jgi:hypothetical protein